MDLSRFPVEVVSGLGLLCATVPFVLADYYRTLSIAENKTVHFVGFLTSLLVLAFIIVFLAVGVGWLRYLLFVFVALSVKPCFAATEPTNPRIKMSAAGRLIVIAQTILESVSLILLFSRPTSDWFAGDR